MNKLLLINELYLWKFLFLFLAQLRTVYLGRTDTLHGCQAFPWRRAEIFPSWRHLPKKKPWQLCNNFLMCQNCIDSIRNIFLQSFSEHAQNWFFLTPICILYRYTFNSKSEKSKFHCITFLNFRFHFMIFEFLNVMFILSFIARITCRIKIYFTQSII